MSGIPGVVHLEPSDISPSGALHPRVCGGRPVLVLVYASWCGYCKQIAPVYQALSDAGLNVFAVQADGDNNDKNCVSMLKSVAEIQGFPTILRFDGRGVFQGAYSGPRDAKSLSAALA